MWERGFVGLCVHWSNGVKGVDWSCPGGHGVVARLSNLERGKRMEPMAYSCLCLTRGVGVGSPIN